MGRRGSRAVTTGRHVMLVAMFSTALLTLMMLLAIPARAQNTNAQYTSSKQTAQVVQGNGQQAQAGTGTDDSQAAARAADSLTNEPVEITEVSDDDDATIFNRIVVSDVDCTVDDGATLTVRDADGTQILLTDNDNVNITQEQGQLVIVGTGKDENLAGVNASEEFGPSNDRGPGRIVSSSRITCGRDAGSNRAGDDDNATTNDDARTADELLDLSCEELLVLFRAGSSSGGQYGDAVALADADVQARIEVCLREEIVEGTAADGDLPEPGGVSVVGLAVLGLGSVAAGLSVIRGRRG